MTLCAGHGEISATDLEVTTMKKSGKPTTGFLIFLVCIIVLNFFQNNLFRKNPAGSRLVRQ